MSERRSAARLPRMPTRTATPVIGGPEGYPLRSSAPQRLRPVQASRTFEWRGRVGGPLSEKATRRVVVGIVLLTVFMSGLTLLVFNGMARYELGPPGFIVNPDFEMGSDELDRKSVV